MKLYNRGFNQRKGVIEMEYQDTEFCPDCGGQLIHQEGCALCPCCGYSLCGCGLVSETSQEGIYEV